MSEVESEVEIDENELFDSAVSDETTDAPVVTEQTEQTEQPTEQAESTAETEAETTSADEGAARVPSFRLKQEAEARRQLETDLANERADKAALRQRLEALERPAPKVEQAKATKPDPLLDPEGYAAAIREEVRQENLNERREESLLRAREANQQDFDEAYAAAQKAVDPALRARMQSSRDPGRTLLEWHRENKVRAEVGSDPNAWLEKKLEERLKDPAFLAKAVELARGSAQSQPQNGRPRVDLPPSLSGASRSNASLRSSNDDVSDAELFAQTTG